MPEDEHIGQSVEEIMKVLGTDRWLLQSGLVSESTQQNLIMYGYLSSNMVSDVEVSVDAKNKIINYSIYMRRKDLSRYQRFARGWEKYSNPVSLWAKWRKLKLVKKAIYMNVQGNLEHMIADYLPQFRVESEVLPYGQARKSESLPD